MCNIDPGQHHAGYPCRHHPTLQNLASQVKRISSKVPPAKLTAPARQKVKLRDFPTVDRQFSHLALTDVAADGRRTGIDESQTCVAYCNLDSLSRWLHRNVDCLFLTYLKRVQEQSGRDLKP